MRTFKSAVLIMMIALWIAGPLAVGPVLRACEQAPQEKAGAGESAPQPEKIVAGPKGIKESTAVYVFLTWIWLLIFVLIYLLRQKVRESDRLCKAKYFRVKARRGSTQTE